MSAQGAAVLADDGVLRDHPAARAWASVDPSRSPESIEVLNPEGRRAVFRLRGAGPGGGGVIAKRRKRGRLDLERRLYSEVLPSLPVPTLEMYGFVEEGDEHSWIFLEDAGERTYEPEQPECGALAAHWLAVLHTRSRRSLAQIPDRGPGYFRSIAASVIDGMRGSVGHPALSPAEADVLRAIESHVGDLVGRWEEVEAACAAAPPALVHGDFVPKNVRVRRQGDRLELIPFDWETAGAGSPAGDVALLPDEASLRRYFSLVCDSWPGLDFADLRRLARAGRRLRLLHYVYWEALPAQLAAWSARYPWIERTMERLAVYERALREPPGSNGGISR